MGDEAAADAATVAMNWRRVFMGRKCLGSKVEGRSVGPCLQGVGALIVHKALCFQIKAERLAEDEFVLAGVHSIGIQVRQHPFVGVGGVLVAFDSLANLCLSRLLSEPVGNVCDVTQRAGDMSFTDVGSEVACLTASCHIGWQVDLGLF